ELTNGKNYQFEVCAYGDQTIKATVKRIEVDLTEIGKPIARPIGGLRINKIENLDPETNKIQTRTFGYGHGGYLVNPRHTLNKGIPFYFSTIGEVNSSNSKTTLTISSSPTGGLGPSSFPVAYHK